MKPYTQTELLHIAKEIEPLLAAEREQVREICVEILEQREPYSQAWIEQKRLLRKLDLTKNVPQRNSR